MAKTIYGEARGEIELGQIAVGYVIKNRAKKGRSSIKDVVLKKYQFEYWTDKDDIPIHEPQAYAKALELAKKVINGKVEDPTKGADHYNNPDKEGSPKWTKNVTPGVKIGNHQFYTEVIADCV